MHQRLLPTCFITVFLITCALTACSDSFEGPSTTTTTSVCFHQESGKKQHVGHMFTYTQQDIAQSWQNCLAIFTHMKTSYRSNPTVLRSIHAEQKKCLKEHNEITSAHSFTYNKLERLEDIVVNLQLMLVISGKKQKGICKKDCFFNDKVKRSI